MAPLTTALKEWSIAVEALLSGDLILLLRKGGLREKAGRFQAQVGDRALLMPTLEHQKPHWLKPPWRDRVDSPAAAQPASHAITLGGWAEITHLHALTDAPQVHQLTPHHIWTSQWAQERMAWQPDRPIYLLLLRVYRLPVPQTVPNHPSYGGCRSWVGLQTALSSKDSTPVLSDQVYGDRVQTVLKHLS